MKKKKIAVLKASPFPPSTEPCGYIPAFVRTFAQHHPWQKGNRHESMLALGRSARRKGFSKEELEKLTFIMEPEIVRDGYTLRELQKDISAGYQYVDLSYAPSSDPNQVPQVPGSTFGAPSCKNNPLDQEEVLINNEKVRSTAPFLPDDIFSNLPAFLQNALKAASNKSDRDILLLGILTNLSRCLPKVSFLYDQRPYTPHLYFIHSMEDGLYSRFINCSAKWSVKKRMPRELLCCAPH